MLANSVVARRTRHSHTAAAHFFFWGWVCHIAVFEILIVTEIKLNAEFLNES